MASCISKEIREILDQICPIKIFQPRKNKPLGLVDNIIEAMDKRDKAKDKSDMTGLKSDKSEYNKLRNKVTSLVRKHNKKELRIKSQQPQTLEIPGKYGI